MISLSGRFHREELTMAGTSTITGFCTISNEVDSAIHWRM